MVASTSCCSIIFSSTGCRGVTRSVSRGASCCCYGGGLSFCTELEVTIGELTESSFVPEKNDLTETCATKLKADGCLHHGRVADVFALFINATFSVSPTN